MINYEQIAKRLEIATRNVALFTANEAESKGMDDRRKITALYNEIREMEETNVESLNKARELIIIEILKEELNNGGQQTDNSGTSERTNKENSAD